MKARKPFSRGRVGFFFSGSYLLLLDLVSPFKLSELLTHAAREAAVVVHDHSGFHSVTLVRRQLSSQNSFPAFFFCGFLFKVAVVLYRTADIRNLVVQQYY